jgi:hypothetical protein
MARIRLAALMIGTTCVVAVACNPFGSTSSVHVSPSPSRTTSTAFCRGLQPGHPLVLALLGANQDQVAVRDVVDPNHGVTLCTVSGGSPRFVSATRVAITNQSDFSIFDLVSGASTPLIHSGQTIATFDWSSDGRLFAYGRLDDGSQSISFHLLTSTGDRVLAAVSGSVIGVGSARIEFSPDDHYIALGALGSLSSGDGASVQVRRPDGTLVFSSGGTGQLTWAGESPKLYFEGHSGVETWDATQGAVPIPVHTWRLPIRSPGGRWLAYEVPGGYPGELRVIDTRSGAERSLGNARDSAWVTSTLIRYTDFVSCASPTPGAEGPPACITQPVIYDMSDNTKSATVLDAVFGTWPKGSPVWGVS